MIHSVYLSLGSNLGDRFLHLKSALKMLQNHINIQVMRVSSVYETAPVDYEQQPDFLNIVCLIQTNLDPYSLLDATQSIESALGRERYIRYGPRTIDIDILLYDSDTIDHQRLTIPHPRMYERAFVMIPLSEINEQVIPRSTIEGQLRLWGVMNDFAD